MGYYSGATDRAPFFGVRWLNADQPPFFCRPGLRLCICSTWMSLETRTILPISTSFWPGYLPSRRTLTSCQRKATTSRPGTSRAARLWIFTASIFGLARASGDHRPRRLGRRFCVTSAISLQSPTLPSDCLAPLLRRRPAVTERMRSRSPRNKSASGSIPC